MLASGGGTILQAILEEGISVEVVVVDRPCGATDVAAAHGVPSALVERSSYGKAFDRLAYTHEVIDVLESYGVELVVMAGFGTIFEKPMFDAYEGRIINTHPALLPAFPGWHAVRDALAAGAEVTGVTVHVATLDVDAGPILAQASVEVVPGDDEETLHERIKVVERRLYPATIKEIIERGSV